MTIRAMQLKQFFIKAGLAFTTVLLSLFATEIVLRFIFPEQEKIYVWQPNLQHTFSPDYTIFYGIKGTSHFSINEDGFRGEMLFAESENYLTIGGSTTECLYLDDKETWQYFLQQKTGKIVGSIGKSGCSTRENYLQLKYFVPQLHKVSGVIMMVGLNDMLKRLSRDTLFENNFQFTQLVEDSLVNQIFLAPAKSNSRWKSLTLVRLFRKFKNEINSVKWENVQDDRGEILQQWRENRSHATAFIDSLPDLNSALNEFERNLQLIYTETQRQQTKLVLVNQAALYSDTMNTFENSLLWMGGIGNFQQQKHCAYYSPRTLRKALNLYNMRMKNFCAGKANVVFVDLDAQLPRDTSVFYDDCHFNESGAKRVAAIISKQL
jgi:lysophospholipase L1-like esterase